MIVMMTANMPSLNASNRPESMMPPGARAPRFDHQASDHSLTQDRYWWPAAAMILAIPAVLILLALVILPQLWISSVLRRYGAQRPAIPLTAALSALHLPAAIKRHALK